LLPNKEGVVDLPSNLQSISSNQKAYVKREADGKTTWVLLLESMDNPSNFKGRLYCSNPPAAKPAKVQVIGPKVGGGAGPVEVTVDGDAPGGWYAVHAGG
jgi:hypothetical protein